MSVVARALVSLMFAVGFVLLAIAVAGCLFFGNFVVAWQSFLAQGWERTPLGMIPFLAAWAQAFGIGAAPIAALWALVVTGGMNLAIMVTNKNLADALRSFFDHRQVLRSDDPATRANAAEFRDLTIEHAIRATVLIIVTFFIIRYDVSQFRLRAESLARGMTDPAEMLRWAPDAVARLGQYFADFIGTATWGYAACIIATALSLEYAIGRAAVRWQALFKAIDAAISIDDQNAERATQGPSPTVRPLSELEDTGALATAAADAPYFSPAPSLAAPAGRDPEPVMPPPPAEPRPAEPPRDDHTTVEVITGPGHTAVLPLTEVQGHPERFVRDGSGRAWFTREYWSQVVGGNGRPEVTP